MYSQLFVQLAYSCQARISFHDDNYPRLFCSTLVVWLESCRHLFWSYENTHYLYISLNVLICVYACMIMIMLIPLTELPEILCIISQHESFIYDDTCLVYRISVICILKGVYCVSKHWTKSNENCQQVTQAKRQSSYRLFTALF